MVLVPYLKIIIYSILKIQNVIKVYVFISVYVINIHPLNTAMPDMVLEVFIEILNIENYDCSNYVPKIYMYLCRLNICYEKEGLHKYVCYLLIIYIFITLKYILEI